MRRFAIRWLMAYLVIYFSAAMPDLVAITGHVSALDWYGRLWDASPTWVGVHLLGIPRHAMAHVYGPSPFEAVKLLVMATSAAMVALVWLWMIRQWEAGDGHDRDAVLYDALRVFVRYTLGLTMLIYAATKVIKTQFPDTGLAELAAPLGQLTPDGLMWAFMGYSPAFNLFAGMGELVGSLLLFFRRTTTLGALLIIAVMSNVVVMDFVYAVNSVTVWATHLLLMAVFLTLPDVQRLINVLVLNRPAAPVPLGPPHAGRWVFPGRVIAKTLAILFAVFQLNASWHRRHTSGDLAPRPALYGAYTVDQFVLRGDSTPPSVTDTVRWRQVIMSRVFLGGRRMAFIRLPNDTVRNYRLRVDSIAQQVTILNPAPSRPPGTPSAPASDPQTAMGSFHYTILDTDRVALSGVLAGDSVRMRLRRMDRSFRLLKPVPWFRVPSGTR